MRQGLDSLGGFGHDNAPAAAHGPIATEYGIGSVALLERGELLDEELLRPFAPGYPTEGNLAMQIAQNRTMESRASEKRRLALPDHMEGVALSRAFGPGNRTTQRELTPIEYQEQQERIAYAAALASNTPTGPILNQTPLFTAPSTRESARPSWARGAHAKPQESQVTQEVQEVAKESLLVTWKRKLTSKLRNLFS